ncbi:unnamed protein product, partial [Musa hybrid cultivar]
FSFQGGKQHGTTVTADLPSPNGLHSVGHSNQRDDVYNDNGHPFHRGIRLWNVPNHWSMIQISNVKEDYDLCTVCFSKTSKEADFTRIDMHPRHRISSPHLHGFGVRRSRPKLESCFIRI